MEKTTGTVKAVSNREGKYGMKLGDVWYNGFGDCPAAKDDEVEVEYELNGDYKNVKKLQVTGKSKPKPAENDDTKTVSMLTSYAKDLVIALVNVNGTSVNIPEAMLTASESIAKAYLKIKVDLMQGFQPADEV